MSKDRKDGIYIKPTDAIHAIVPYLMETRTEAEVYSNRTLDVTNLKKWIDKKNKKLDFKMTYFHALSSAFVKAVYNRPLMNRFVQGHRLYERKGVSISFVAKDKFTDNAEEKILVLDVKKDMNAISLADRMINDIRKTRESGTNSIDKLLKLVTKMPRFLFKIFFKIIKWLDYHGKLPKAITEGDSNYATILLSNLGSIKCDSCYHHLNNYGTNSIVITIGTVREENGKFLVDVGFTLDERIADGFYFAKTIKLIQYIINNPELLEDKMDTIVNYEEAK